MIQLWFIFWQVADVGMWIETANTGTAIRRHTIGGVVACSSA